MIIESSQQDSTRGPRDTIVILGGKGGFEARYREVAKRYGYELNYYEQRVPTKTRPSKNRIAMVIVMVSMISHPLMAHARGLADEGTEVVYLRSPSLSAVRDTLDRTRTR
jgi:hypothetical protein